MGLLLMEIVSSRLALGEDDDSLVPGPVIATEPIMTHEANTPFSDSLSVEISYSMAGTAYTYLLTQLEYCSDTCPVDWIPPKKIDEYQIWIPFVRLQTVPVSDVKSNAALNSEIVDNKDLSDSSKTQFKWDLYLSSNLFAFQDAKKYLHKVCEVGTDAELRDALKWALGWSKEHTFKNEDLTFGKSFTTWAFDHMCLTGARRYIQTKLCTPSEDGKQVTCDKNPDDPCNAGGASVLCGEKETTPTGTEYNVFRYKLFSKVCEAGKVNKTTNTQVAMWKRVQALPLLGTGSAVTDPCMLGDDGKAVTRNDVTAKKLQYVWVVDPNGCFDENCVLEKTIALKGDAIALSSSIVLHDRASVSLPYEVTVNGDPKNKTTLKRSDTGKTPVFDFKSNLNSLTIKNVIYAGTQPFVAGSDITLSDNNLSNSAMLVGEGWRVHHNVLKAINTTVPFFKTKDGVWDYSITSNSFEGTPPKTIVQLGAPATEWGNFYPNTMQGLFKDAKPLSEWVSNSPVKPPKMGSDALTYFSSATTQCTGKIHIGGIGCYRISLQLDPKSYAVELLTKTGESLGIFCRGTKSQTVPLECDGILEVSDAGAAKLWIAEYQKGSTAIPAYTVRLDNLQIPEGGGAISPAPLFAIAYINPVNKSVGVPSPFGPLTVDFFAGSFTADAINKAKFKYNQWATGPVAKWASACVDNKTCGKEDSKCKMDCGWVNACAELQKEIDRLTKKENPNYIDPMGYWVEWKSDQKKYVSKIVLNPKDSSPQPKAVQVYCQAYSGNDFKKLLWKQFGGALDYEPEDPVALACYWDSQSKQQTGQHWMGGKCVATAKSKCIWDAAAKKMTGKIWKGESSEKGLCHDNEESLKCSEKGMKWQGGKCQSDKEICVAQGKVFADNGSCTCPAGTLPKDNGCVQPPPKNSCKSNEELKEGLCVAVKTGGGAGGGDTKAGGGGTTPQSAATPETVKPLTGATGEAVQQTPEDAAAEESGSRWNKFWGCSLIR